MENPVIIYSVNTKLAFFINTNYYNHTHYVWCSPFFNPKTDNNIFPPPRSSTPCEIYSELVKDVKSNDEHSAKIKSNRLGLLEGVVANFEKGIIDEDTKEELKLLISEAPISAFEPLIYVIPFSDVKSLVEKIPLSARASKYSSEIKIPVLSRSKFDIIYFKEN